MLSNFEVGIVGVIIMVVLIGLRMHIGLAMALVACGGITVIAGPRVTYTILQVVPYEFANSWEFSAVPMFILMGTVAYRAGMTAALFRAARLWLARLPGGLAVAANFGCAGFAAAAGSSVVTAVSMGRIAVPEMLRYRYDPALATGVVASAGTLGVMIPPSIPLVLFGYFAEVSVAQLFIAGILPGLLTALVYTALIVGRCWLNPDLAPPVELGTDPREKWQALAEVWPLPAIILVVIGTIYTGFASPTEAAAFGAVASVVIAALQRKLNWAVMKKSLLETIETSAAIFLVVIGAVLLTRFMAFSDLPETIAQIVIGYGVDQLTLIIVTGLIFLVLGCFLDPIGLLLLALPVFLPIYIAADVNLIWFGIIFIKYIEIGLITPPIGVNIFALKSILPKIPIQTIFRGVMWFFVADIFVLVLLIAFPQITLFLPSLMR